jgi:uncharacterized membrane protein
MTKPFRFAGTLALIAATLIVAALVHVIVVLIAPSVATRNAFARLASLGGLNETFSLPRASQAERLLPYVDPAVAMAYCRYDLASGPIRVRAPAGRSFSSISFHTRRDVVFYALTDKAATNGIVDVVLGAPEDIRALAAHDDEESPSHDLRIAAPVREGYVVSRVFSEFPSLYPEAEAEAKRLTCEAEPIPR